MECFRSFILASISVFFGAGFSAAELMEDFNAGIPADWQVIDISGSSNVLGWDVNTAIVENGNVRGNFTTGDGTAAHIDSRAFGAFGGNADVSLNSPEFTVPENGSLSFAHSFRSIDDFDFAHVEITNDGGSTWNSLATFEDSVGVSPPSPFTLNANTGVLTTIDLEDYEFDDVEIRFRYESLNQGFWWQVDNVQVTAQASSTAVPEISSFLMFSTCLVGYFAAGLRRKKLRRR